MASLRTVPRLNVRGSPQIRGVIDLTPCGRARPGLDRRRPVLRLGADRQVLRVKAAEPAARTRMRWIEPHGCRTYPDADTVPDEHTAPSHDGVERLAGFIFQPLGLRYSVVLAVVGGLNAALQRIASHRVPPVPRSSLGSN